MAIVEVVEPIALNAKLVERNHHHFCTDMDISIVPTEIRRCFDDDIIGNESDKNVFVTLGLFSIIKLERNVQLLIPVIDFCIPEKECVGSTEDSPCELFDTINFPVDEFFPPNACNLGGGSMNFDVEKSNGSCIGNQNQNPNRRCNC